MSWLCSAGAGGASRAVLSVQALGFPFECESPFLFAVYHLDRYPKGNKNLGPAATLAGHHMGADFGNPSGWNMYHGDTVPGFPRHPHRGFETVTIVRRGMVDHADSMGNSGRFGDGDVQWMTAGSGICHCEMFPLLDQENENVLELFQVWLNLPRRSKMVTPGYRMLWTEDIPKLMPGSAGTGDVTVTLIHGEFNDMPPPPAPPPDSYATDPASDILILTVQLGAGSSFTLPRYAGPRPVDGLNRNLYVFAGKTASVDGMALNGTKRVKTRPDADVTVDAGRGPVDVLILQGRDIGEPVVQRGPFVMSTPDEIRQATLDYQRTEFGGWKFSSDSVVQGRDRPRFMAYGDGTLDERPR